MKTIRELSKEIIKLVIAALFCIVICALVFWYIAYSEGEDEYVEDVQEEPAEEVCNVSGIDLRGELVTYISSEEHDGDGDPLVDQVASEEVIWAINEAKGNDDIRAIIIEVDSYGGSPTAAEEINSSIKHSDKPVVVYIRSAGLSAAYWAISGADRIIALPSATVGSIGITASYLDNTKYNMKEGFTYNSLSTGKYKDMMDMDKPLTLEERDLVMRDMHIMRDNFIKTVSENRGIDVDKVETIADGSSLVGQMALDNGLIDQVGAGYDVKEYLNKILGEKAVICW